MSQIPKGVNSACKGEVLGRREIGKVEDVCVCPIPLQAKVLIFYFPGCVLSSQKCFVEK